MKTKMKHLPIITLVLTLLSCSNDNLTTLTDLNGKWVDINTMTDTLTFALLGDKESMILGRGKEIRNGFLLPKHGSGSYDYELLTDTISLRWVASGNLNFRRYYFNKTRTNIIIEKFFDTNTRGTFLTFKRIN